MPTTTPKPRPLKVVNESGNGLSNVRGTVGLARTTDPHGGNSQFYVNLNDNAALDPNADTLGLCSVRPRDQRHGRGRSDRQCRDGRAWPIQGGNAAETGHDPEDRARSPEPARACPRSA